MSIALTPTACFIFAKPWCSIELGFADQLRATDLSDRSSCGSDSVDIIADNLDKLDTPQANTPELDLDKSLLEAMKGESLLHALDVTWLSYTISWMLQLLRMYFAQLVSSALMSNVHSS